MAIPPARGRYTFDKSNFCVYRLPGDIETRWTDEDNRRFTLKIADMSRYKHNGRMDLAFQEWAQSAGGEELELARKALWEWKHLQM